MPRSSHYSKGQWMLVSAVIVISSFLAISLSFKGFFLIDSSTQARDRTDLIFKDVKEQFERVVDTSPCSVLEPNLNDYIAFVETKMGETGYLVHVEYQKIPGGAIAMLSSYYSYECLGDPSNLTKVRNIGKGIIVATENSLYYSGIARENLTKIIPGVLG